MRGMMLAAAIALGSMSTAADAQRPIVRDGSRPVPDVRIRAPGAADAGTSWRAPASR